MASSSGERAPSPCNGEDPEHFRRLLLKRHDRILQGVTAMESEALSIEFQRRVEAGEVDEVIEEDE